MFSNALKKYSVRLNTVRYVVDILLTDCERANQIYVVHAILLYLL